MNIPREDFDWGLWKSIGEEQYIINEIFINREYEQFVEVEEGDIVVDVGASVGPFTESILDKKPQKVYCVEPDKRNLPVLRSNLSKPNVTIVEKGIGPRNGFVVTTGLIDQYSQMEYSRKLNSIEVVKFSTFIEEQKIDRIDFLKLDCEGHEYDILNAENLEWVLNNVKKISGEFHLHNDLLKEKFHKFRSNYLTRLSNFRIHDVKMYDITRELWLEDFIPHYKRFYVYIDNRNK